MTALRTSVRTLLPVALGTLLLAPTGSAAGSSSLDDARERALERQLLEATQKVEGYYLRDLAKVAALCITKGLPDEAEAILEKMARIQPDYELLEKLRAALDKSRVSPEETAGDPTDESEIETLRKAVSSRLETLSERHARRLFDLATQCMKVGLFTRAYGLVQDVIEADPDHRRARKALSHEWDRTSQTWITEWEYDMRRTHYLTDEGWVAKRDRSRWEKGLRPYRGKWIPAEEEKRLRLRNNYNPFSVETEHFEVQSNLGREKAFEFALRLEDFYRAFFELFVGFYDQKAGATLLFNAAPLEDRHVVSLFPSRVEYLDFVRAEKGNNELLIRSAGFWSAADQRSYFYWTEDPDRTIYTLYHETTHQLFGETTDGLGRSQGNVWIVEGIANYMECLEKVRGKWRPGYRIDNPEIQGIRKFLSQHPDWKLASYIALDHKAFHEKQNRGLHYALGGALSHFFMHYEGGIYQEDFILLLRAYYDGKLAADSLPEYIRVEGATTPSETLQEIEKQFRAYMKDLKRPGEGTDSTGGN